MLRVRYIGFDLGFVEEADECLSSYMIHWWVWKLEIR